jgi:hypothetical protein
MKKIILSGKKFLKFFSALLLLMNPVCGFLIIASVFYSNRPDTYGWWWAVMIIISIVVVFCTMKFNEWTHRDDLKRLATRRLMRNARLSRDHKFLFSDSDGVEYWEHLRTHKITKV